MDGLSGSWLPLKQTCLWNGLQLCLVLGAFHRSYTCNPHLQHYNIALESLRHTFSSYYHDWIFCNQKMMKCEVRWNINSKYIVINIVRMNQRNFIIVAHMNHWSIPVILNIYHVFFPFVVRLVIRQWFILSWLCINFWYIGMIVLHWILFGLFL